MQKYMQKFWFPLLLIAGIVLWSNACYYDNEEDLYGGENGCDTTNIKYSAQVTALLENNCYACHSTSNNISGLPFDTYESLLPVAQSGQLVNAINNAGDPMPPTGLLPACDREKIESWVNAGAPKN